uniref:Uncharacterized protein n=1 Tax=Anopheles maculatus TaxID=74869 RepID=A0A182SYN2_9DIPT
MATIEDLPKAETTHNMDNYVSRQKYDQLLEDYNKLKETNELNGTTEHKNDPDVFEAYMSRINRFENLMKELQEDFLAMKASVRSRALVNDSGRHAMQRLRGDESAINYVMTIVHPKSRTN